GTAPPRDRASARADSVAGAGAQAAAGRPARRRAESARPAERLPLSHALPSCTRALPDRGAGLGRRRLSRGASHGMPFLARDRDSGGGLVVGEPVAEQPQPRQAANILPATEQYADSRGGRQDNEPARDLQSRQKGTSMSGFKVMIWAGVLTAWAGGAMAEATLRIGLAEDPEILDPTLGRTFLGRIVFAGMCDKLFDIAADLKIVPQLATGYSWSADNRALTVTLRSGVKFQDGEPMDAAAAKYSIERHLKMQGSFRRAEIGAVTSVDVVDDHTVRLNLSTPFAPLLAQLTDRAGMMVSPKAAEAAGDKFGNHPVCAGPYKFVERVAQDRIVLDKFADYWDKDNI